MKRAISPVIATLLLIVTAVTGAIMFYSFMTTFVTQLTSQTSRIDVIKIDSAYLMEDQGSPDKQDKIWLAVRNIGREPAYLLDSVIILDSDGRLVTVITNLNYNPSNVLTNGLSQGQAVEIYKEGNGLFELTVGEWYTLRVTTTKGGVDEIRVKCTSS